MFFVNGYLLHMWFALGVKNEETNEYKQVTKCFKQMFFPLQLSGSKFEAFEILI
jgi:hypothetical protein